MGCDVAVGAQVRDVNGLHDRRLFDKVLYGSEQ